MRCVAVVEVLWIRDVLSLGRVVQRIQGGRKLSPHALPRRRRDCASAARDIAELQRAWVALLCRDLGREVVARVCTSEPSSSGEAIP